MPKYVEKGIEYGNYTFSIIFLIEAVIKIIAFGGRYFTDNWNIFDFMLVIATTFGMVTSMISDSLI